MAATLKETEETPASYPPPPSGLSTAAAALDNEMIWQRIESYIAHRWTARDVTWIVEGAGDWIPPLAPATISATEVWRNEAWEAIVLTPSPMGGYCLRGCGLYRSVASVGGGTVPPIVNEAYRRLAEYFASISARDPSLLRERVDGVSEVEYSTSQTLVARALVNSGAADLLRQFRRLQC